jgi:hypothetical protein
MQVMLDTYEGFGIPSAGMVGKQGVAAPAVSKWPLGMPALLYMPAFASLCKCQPPIILPLSAASESHQPFAYHYNTYGTPSFPISAGIYSLSQEHSQLQVETAVNTAASGRNRVLSMSLKGHR